jgi:hypothetical protein
MYVMQLTRVKGGTDAEMIQAAREAKTIVEKHGAEFFRLQRFHSGPFIGEWVVAVRFADWTTYGKVQDALANDAEYQALLTRVRGMAEFTGRAVLAGIDL